MNETSTHASMGEMTCRNNNNDTTLKLHQNQVRHSVAPSKQHRQELLDALLDYWEREMTDTAIEAARRHAGSPTDRIFYIMETIMILQ